MTLVCKTCGYKIENMKIDRCPRCHTIIKKLPKCADCKGCSLSGKGCKGTINNINR